MTKDLETAQEEKVKRMKLTQMRQAAAGGF